MSPVVRATTHAPVELRGRGVSARVRPWPGEPAVAQLVVVPATAPLRIAALVRAIGVWVDELRGQGFEAVRTNAVPGAVADALMHAGFDEVQRLALLAHDAPAAVTAPTAATVRLSAAQDELVAAIDAAAFAVPWALDRAGVADVRSATPRHRTRGTCPPAATGVAADQAPVAFAISGRSGRHGYLQRLAVHPAHRRQGHATTLVRDALRWMARWRVSRAFVNTHVDNTAALRLYQQLGFTRLDDDLRVLGRSLG